MDVWKEGLLGRFFEPVFSVALADVPEGDVRLAGGWGKVEEADTNKFRTVAGQASIKLEAPAKGRVLVRIKLGTGTASLTDTTKISLSIGNACHEDAVCKARWVTWLLPEARGVSQVTVNAEKPVRAYAMEIYAERRTNAAN